MQIVSLFPAFFDYQLLGIFAIRVALGALFIYLWYEKAVHARANHFHFFEKLGLRPAKIYHNIVSYVEGIIGALLFVGLYTQGAAIAAGVLMVATAIIKWKNPEVSLKNGVEFYIMLAVVSFSLLFLGPGAFAIDLPL